MNSPRLRLSRADALFGIFTLVAAALIVRLFSPAPNYTDAYYHFNAASRLVAGHGLTDPYLWTYIGAPERLPESGVFASHTYWMPLTSLIAAVGMFLFGAAGDYGAAQVGLILCYAAAVWLAYALGWRFGRARRHAWVAGLVALFSGFFVRFWGAVDTFAPYAAFGGGCLIALGAGLERPNSRWRWMLAGTLAALGHLTRADGLLLLIVGYLLLVISRGLRPSMRLQAALLLTAGYLVVMTPWLLRNLSAIGTPFPLGGTQAIWFTEYNDLFKFPPDSSPERLFALGLTDVWETRATALVNNLGTFIAVEGLIAMTPLMVIGWFIHRRDPFARAFAWYALGLHLAMTFVFPFPGYRGGLFHSAAALVPFWSAFGAAGLDAVVEWIARRRRRWRVGMAKMVFATALVALAIGLSFVAAGRAQPDRADPALLSALRALPAGSRVMINDVARLYYETGLPGVVLPNEPPEVIAEIARRYAVTHVVVEWGNNGPVLPNPLLPLVNDPPSFLREIPLEGGAARLYAIELS